MRNHNCYLAGQMPKITIKNYLKGQISSAFFSIGSIWDFMSFAFRRILYPSFIIGSQQASWMCFIFSKLNFSLQANAVAVEFFVVP